jgi:hypothetical protein
MFSQEGGRVCGYGSQREGRKGTPNRLSWADIAIKKVGAGSPLRVVDWLRYLSGDPDPSSGPVTEASDEESKSH